MGVVIIWPLTVLPAQVVSWVLLVVAKRRHEKPRWAYFSALLPLMLVVMLIIVQIVEVMRTK